MLPLPFTAAIATRQAPAAPDQCGAHTVQILHIVRKDATVEVRKSAPRLGQQGRHCPRGFVLLPQHSDTDAFPFLCFWREMLIIAEQPMKLHLQLMGQSEMITVRGTSFFEMTLVVYQGTKPSYQSSVFQDPEDSFVGQFHIDTEKKKYLHRALIIEPPNTQPPQKSQSPEPFCFTVPSNEYGVENGGWKKKGKPPPP